MRNRLPRNHQIRHQRSWNIREGGYERLTPASQKDFGPLVATNFPFLVEKIFPKLSVGRSQSVAVRLITDREKEIKLLSRKNTGATPNTKKNKKVLKPIFIKTRGSMGNKTKVEMLEEIQPKRNTSDGIESKLEDKTVPPIYTQVKIFTNCLSATSDISGTFTKLHCM